MKKFFSFFLALSAAAISFSQPTSKIAEARAYNNANIVTNTTKSISAVKVNTAIEKVLQAVAALKDTSTGLIWPLRSDTAGNAYISETWIDSLQPYTEYVGLFSQVGTSVPTVLVYNNTLPGSITWTRTSAGFYKGTLEAAFTYDKTFVTPMQHSITVADKHVFVYNPSADEIYVLVRKISDGSFADLNQVQAIPIEVRVYK